MTTHLVIRHVNNPRYSATTLSLPMCVRARPSDLRAYQYQYWVFGLLVLVY